MRYIDTHCHLNDKYKIDIQEALTEALSNNVLKIIIPSTSKEDSLEAIEISKKHNNVYAAAAIHPADVFDKSWEFLNFINPKDIVGIGETGLDLYRESNPALEIQIQSFVFHLEYARKNNLTVIVHSRSAEKETYDILKNYVDLRIIMHSFTGPTEWAQRFASLGFYISISGIVTFKNAEVVKETAKKIPLNQLLSETDTPYLTPVPYRGKINKPSYVKFVADEIAVLRSESKEEVLNALYENALRAFNL